MVSRFTGEEHDNNRKISIDMHRDGAYIYRNDK